MGLGLFGRGGDSGLRLLIEQWTSIIYMSIHQFYSLILLQTSYTAAELYGICQD